MKINQLYKLKKQIEDLEKKSNSLYKEHTFQFNMLIPYIIGGLHIDILYITSKQSPTGIVSEVTVLCRPLKDNNNEPLLDLDSHPIFESQNGNLFIFQTYVDVFTNREINCFTVPRLELEQLKNNFQAMQEASKKLLEQEYIASLNLDTYEHTRLLNDITELQQVAYTNGLLSSVTDRAQYIIDKYT